MIAQNRKSPDTSRPMSFMMQPPISPRYRHADRALRSVSDIIAYSAGAGAAGAAIAGPVGLVTGSSLVAIAGAAMLLSQRSLRR